MLHLENSLTYERSLFHLMCTGMRKEYIFHPDSNLTMENICVPSYESLNEERIYVHLLGSPM